MVITMKRQAFRTAVSYTHLYWLQMKLKELGYYTGTVTGGYYNGTAAAVKAFQKDNGLKADGVADTNTLEKVYESVLSANTPTPESTETPAMTATPEATPSPTAAPSAPPSLAPAPSGLPEA